METVHTISASTTHDQVDSVTPELKRFDKQVSSNNDALTDSLNTTTIQRDETLSNEGTKSRTDREGVKTSISSPDEVQMSSDSSSESSTPREGRIKSCLSTTEFIPDVLVLGPGGVKGTLELGAMMYLEKSKVLEKVTKVAGVSIGSVIGLLWLAGLPLVDIASSSIKFNMMDMIGNIQEIGANISRLGLVENTSIKKHVETLLINKLGLVPSFEQLYTMTGKDFMCVGFNIDKKEPIYFDRRQYPNMSCLDAVIMSISIPVLITRGGLAGDDIIDGALGDPYPIAYYTKIDPQLKILGVYIDNCNKRTDLLGYVLKMIDAMINNLKRISISLCTNEHLCISLGTTVIDTTGVTLSRNEKIEMIASGYFQARDQFQSYSSRREGISNTKTI